MAQLVNGYGGLADLKGSGNVGIKLDNGEIERQLIFHDREPEYVIDELEGIVYRTHKNGKEIIAMDVPKS